MSFQEIDQALAGKIEPIEVCGIGNFDKKVVFADIMMNPSLAKIGEITRNNFKDFSGGSEHLEWNPHLTLFKPQRKS